jgi:hypothetical protein
MFAEGKLNNLPSTVTDKRREDGKPTAEHWRGFFELQFLRNRKCETFVRSDGSGISSLRNITLRKSNKPRYTSESGMHTFGYFEL